jgi:CDP-diacylglycerol--glycerol-3-phosphate 3-phosphatidyltransferase
MLLPVAYIPNTLSLSRIPLGGLFLLTYTTGSRVGFWHSIAVLALALITDFLDGYLARSWNVESLTGYLLDGLGDKVFYAAILLVIAREDATQVFPAWALIARELIWYGIRAIDAQQKKHIKYLRFYSLAFALVIRLYFLCFLVRGACVLYEYPIPEFLNGYAVVAFVAITVGYIQIFSLSKVIIVDLEHSQNDGNQPHA